MKKKKLYWYKLRKRSKAYHCFKRSSRIYPFESVTFCGIYAKSVIEDSETTKPKLCCKKCVKEIEDY